MLWLNTTGQIIQNVEGGYIVDCDVCPCVTCLDCSDMPGSIDLTFAREPSNAGTPSGWIGTWHLTYAGGCCFTKITDLPCTCTQLSACITNSGSDGDYRLWVIATYPGDVHEGFTYHKAIDPVSTDCKANGNGAASTAGYGPGDGGPCNFTLVAFDPTMVSITSNA